jgi:hypothetical protein
MPLLEPDGVLFSSSLFLDVRQFWDKRSKLFNAQQVKTFEEFDKKSAAFLLGRRLSTLLAKSGSHLRFVVVKQPGQEHQALSYDVSSPVGYALVWDMRDPELGKSIESILRGAGLLGDTGQAEILPGERRRREADRLPDRG